MPVIASRRQRGWRRSSRVDGGQCDEPQVADKYCTGREGERRHAVGGGAVCRRISGRTGQGVMCPCVAQVLMASGISATVAPRGRPLDNVTTTKTRLRSYSTNATPQKDEPSQRDLH